MRAASRRWIVRAAMAALLSYAPHASGSVPVRQNSAPDVDVVAVLMKASTYLAGYVKAFSSVVSEERFDQLFTRKRDATTGGMTLTRTLLSDYLLVAVSGSSEWMAFRDVYSVDGTAIRDRSDRLLKLFVEAPPDAYTQALRIRKESSRYNIGSATWDTNVPTFAFLVLTDEWRPGFSFKLKGRERLAGTDTVVVEYVETSSPTLIVGRNDEDVPARGRFWIDPVDGRILRTLLETRPGGTINTLEVTFRYEPRLDLLVPGEMVERRNAGAEIVEGKATYSNFRRFRVDTTMEIK